MEIKLVKMAGVPRAEVEAHQQIQREFSSSPLSKNWRGYASFALARGGRGTGDDDLDLVLVTHTCIVLVELKNWHGKHLESNGHKWFLDGDDRGDSPVSVVRRKVPKLVSVMTQKMGRDLTPFIKSYVVMHGRIGKMSLAPEEKDSVLTMTEFLSFRFDHAYRKYLSGRHFFKPVDHLHAYDEFFLGKSFKPKIYYVDGFKPEANAIFEHPRKLYAEFRAEAKDDAAALALFRQWDFGSLGLDLIGESDRSFIGLREQKVFQYIAERNEELSLSLLRPVAWKSPKDVTLDFKELFFLPSRLTRLAEFVHATLHKLGDEERLLLVKAILARFAELHDMRVAHRDIGEHSLWIDRPTKVVMSGFPAAYYPELKTVGAFRDRVKVEQGVLPEDAANDAHATPYRRDVFMLGVLAHLVLFGEKPAKVQGVHGWAPRPNDPHRGGLDAFFQGALHPESAARFPDARTALEALNAATANVGDSIVDFAVFDAFKALTKERDYEATEVVTESDEHSCFRSGAGTAAKLVKVWYGVEPDAKRPDLSVRLLSFLERARTLKGCDLNGLARIADFGLSRKSLLVVSDWVEGLALPSWLDANPSQAQRLCVARSLNDTLQRLHGFELAHGDIHPKNIVVTSRGEAVFIDALDFRRGSDDVYTTAYLPDNYKSLTPFDRDRYSHAAVLAEILGANGRAAPLQGPHAPPRVYEELQHLLTSDTVSSLEPLGRALALSNAEQTQNVPEFAVTIKNLAYEGVPAGELRSDNGHFHVSVQQDRQSENGLRFWITGIGRQLAFVWDRSTGRCSQVRASTISQSQLLRSQMMRDAPVRMRLSLVEGPVADLDELADFLLREEGLQRRLAALPNSQISNNATSEGRDAQGRSEIAAGSDAVPIRELWRALMEAEEEAFVTVTIAGEHRRNPYRDNQILIPYHSGEREIDYTTTEKVIVESLGGDGAWRSCGELNLRESSFGQLAELAVDFPFMKANLRIGSKLRLVSTLEKGSYTRRRLAVDRILADKAVVPGLVDYFESQATSHLAPITHPLPTDADLDAYSEGDKKLNPSQKEAFRCVLGNGPVSLLQGPPGTGKTWFIAALLHYLMTKERARRILLVSQAHEAVNNALEKGLELCRSKGIEFDAVRLGTESAASDEIRHLHSASIEQSYRDKFKAELKERIVRLAAPLGLSAPFVEAIVDLHMRLGMLHARIMQIRSRAAEDPSGSASQDARIRALTGTFVDIAGDVYGHTGPFETAQALVELENTLIERHEVRSADAIGRLKSLIHLSEDWLNALGSPDANFAEFLAKSRTVVAGTLVGIGYRGAGVTQNVFDWVIIDEAGRAAPSELAVAMQAGHRVLLVGDHLQLPPTFSQEMRGVVKQRFACDDTSAVFQSDFERVFSSDYGRQVGATLLSQYRMTPAIGELVSSCFYDERLETGRGSSPGYYALLPAQLSAPVTWIDTAPLGSRGHHQKSADGAETSNRAEARVVMRLLRQIIESHEFMALLADDLKPQEPPIGIICMYDKQRELIDQMKAEAGWLGDARRLVKVDTVDSYQGKENRIILLSTVRNHPHASAGFLRSPNRINVAMSRAMERLFIVGSSTMWKGRHAELPLGKVVAKIETMAQQGSAAILPASLFLED
ncbi:DNA helicase [Burkholderiales bacterium 8X]|nr:DNA helicase [Burkholderiales bacterium 8X]